MTSIEYDLSDEPHWHEVGGFRAGADVADVSGLKEDFKEYAKPRLQRGMGLTLIIDATDGTRGLLVQPICGGRTTADGFSVRYVDELQLDDSLGSDPFILRDRASIGNGLMFAEPMPATLVGGRLAGGRAKKAKRSAKRKSPKRSAKGKSPKRRSPRRG